MDHKKMLLGLLAAFLLATTTLWIGYAMESTAYDQWYASCLESPLEIEETTQDDACRDYGGCFTLSSGCNSKWSSSFQNYVTSKVPTFSGCAAISRPQCWSADKQRISWEVIEQ